MPPPGRLELFFTCLSGRQPLVHFAGGHPALKLVLFPIFSEHLLQLGHGELCAKKLRDLVAKKAFALCRSELGRANFTLGVARSKS